MVKITVLLQAVHSVHASKQRIMVSFYRCVRYPEKTLITFQGSQRDRESLQTLLPSNIGCTDPYKSRIAEAGYYTYVYGVQDDRYERAVKDYFIQNFVPPDIELLIFESVTPVNNLWSIEKLHRNLSDAIVSLFQKRNYSTNRGNLGWEIYRKQPRKILKFLSFYEGITYIIKVQQNFKVRIQVDIVFRPYLNGKYVNPKVLHIEFAKQPNVLAEWKSFTTRNTVQIFEISKSFIKSINVAFKQVAELNGFEFSLEPLTSKDLRMEVWFWEHESPIRLKIGGGNIVPSAHYISEYKSCGLYQLPSKPIVVILIHPTDEYQKWHNFSNWNAIRKIIKNVSHDMLSQEIQIFIQKYEVENKQQDRIIFKCEEALKGFEAFTPLFLIIAPPKGCRESNVPELKELDLFTSRLDKSLRKFQGYTVTIGWDNLSYKESSNENHYVVENALLKGLMVLGAVPWQVLMLKSENEQYERNVCFIGIDVNPRKSIAGGVILDTFGVLTAQHIVRTSLANEDKIDGDALSLLVQKLINHYRSNIGIQPKHIVIHRDGLMKDNLTLLTDYLRKSEISYDILEVKKNGSPRMKQPNNVDGIPLKDIAVGNEEDSIAYLCNTITFPEYLSNGVVFPAPDGITIHRVYGKTSMKMLAAQVFALSRASVGSYRRTEKLPATIVYADALVSHACLKEHQRDFGKPVNQNTRATWL